MDFNGPTQATALFAAGSLVQQAGDFLFDFTSKVTALVGLALTGYLGFIFFKRWQDPKNAAQEPALPEIENTPAPAESRKVEAPPARFTWELLQALEWRAFERLVTGYFRAMGNDADRKRAGADGGVDIVIRRHGETEPFAYAQCKAWSTYTVGVKPVRELFGVMAADGVAEGFFFASRDFTREAREFAKSKPLTLVTGGELLDKLNHLDEQSRATLFREITAGDYRTPTCPRCDVQMITRESKGDPFWGCPNYGPAKCRQTFKLREAE